MKIRGFFAIALLLGPSYLAASTRIKELAALEGVRENQLLGYGLVVGLAGTGDKRQTVFSAQSLANMLERMGVSVPPTAMLVRNTAAVMITANLPSFAQPGTRIDVSVAAIGDASSLRGGLLLLTPLRAANGQVYAAAQGQVVVGGFVAGQGGTTQTLNHPTSGRIPGGAIVEQRAPAAAPTSALKLQLNRPDFTTAATLAEIINKKLAPSGEPIARAENAAVISVNAPAVFKGRPVEFVAAIENLSVETDSRAKIAVDEKTGTIVMGSDIRITPVSILHGSLTVEIQTSLAVSQPAPLSSGSTQVVPQVGVGVKEDKAQSVMLNQGATVQDLVRALTAIGSTARDVIAILQTLRAAGALDAEIEVI